MRAFRNAHIPVAVSAICATAMLLTSCQSDTEDRSSPVFGQPHVTCLPDTRRECTEPGTIRWSHRLNGTYILHDFADIIVSTRSDPNGDAWKVVETDDLLITADGSLLQAIDFRTGRVRWRTELLDHTPVARRAVGILADDSRVAVALEAGHFGDGDLQVFVLDSEDGSLVGKLKAQGQLYELKSLAESRLTFTTLTDDKEQRWVLELPSDRADKNGDDSGEDFVEENDPFSDLEYSGIDFRLVNKDHGLLRLVDAGPGPVQWKGPWLAYPQLIAGRTKGPNLIVGLACEPGALRPARLDDPTPRPVCDRPRLIALNLPS